jgi:hypothetical protein
MGKSTISMAIFNSYVKLPEGNMMPTEMLYGMEFQPNFIISLVTNVRCCTGNQFFSEAPGSGIKGRPAPAVASDAPPAR